MNSTDALVDFALSEQVNVDGDALTFTLLDTLGVGLAGNISPVVEVLRNWNDSHAMPGSARVWGTALQCDAARAALLNGTAAHALDFDDASPSMPMHASAVVWPALLAVADERSSSLDDLFQAATVGQAVFRTIAEALPMSSHYPRGWHSTATIGRIAGTLAVARLVGLSSVKTTQAIGIAASMAAGSIANFGTMTKPLHAGQAAQDAVLAVQLAEAGLTSNESQLDHSKGFFALFGDPARDRSDIADRLKFWEENWTTDVSFKRYPSCYGTHRAIDGMLKIREQIGADDEITGIEVMVHLVGLEPLIAEFPTSGLEAKFNLAYTVGLAAIKGSVVLADFDGDWTCPDDVRKLMGVTTISTAPFPPDKPEIDGTPFSRVLVRTSSGKTFAETVVFTRGDARNPMSDEELLAKMVSCGVSGGFDREGVESLGAVILALYPNGDISHLQLALKDVVA